MDKEIKKSIINFGKIDYMGNGRKENALDIQLILRQNNNHPCLEFSVTGTVWNRNHTDCLTCGQIIDDKNIVDKLQGKTKELYMTIKDLWEKYHLNCTHSGTIEQTKFLKEHKVYGYTEQREFLKEHNMLTVELTDEEKRLNPNVKSPYTFGTGWLAYEIPENDMNKINYIIDTYGKTTSIDLMLQTLNTMDENGGFMATLSEDEVER